MKYHRKRKTEFLPKECAYLKCKVVFIPTREWQEYHEDRCRKLAWKESNRPAIKELEKQIKDHEERIQKLEIMGN